MEAKPAGRARRAGPDRRLVGRENRWVIDGVEATNMQSGAPGK